VVTTTLGMKGAPNTYEAHRVDIRKCNLWSGLGRNVEKAGSWVYCIDGGGLRSRMSMGSESVLLSGGSWNSRGEDGNKDQKWDVCEQGENSHDTASLAPRVCIMF